MSKTVTEMIGDEYKEWMKVNNNTTIFITSPTGSGKTFFILHSLLPYLSEEKKKILYLVNRKILKEQIEEEIICCEPEYSDMICVESYQNIEKQLRDTPFDTRSLPSNDYDCVVCDECHYFLADANYNTNTDLSFDWVFNRFINKPKIFISATIDNIKSYVETEEENRKYAKTRLYHFPFITASREILYHDVSFYYPKESDCQKRDYSYININIIERNEIVDVVLSKNDKWLIFVDNIRFGRKIKQEIENYLEADQSNNINKRVVMITSDYEQDEESFSEVDMITNNSKFSAEVIIATSVMDNGITIKDIALRNVIVIADTETQFIQMLGRKRMDNKPLNLYIVRQTKGHFLLRKKNATKILKIALKYMKPFNECIKIPLKRMENIQSDTYDWYDKYEANIYVAQHLWLMNELADHKIQWEDVCNLFRICQGTFYLNLLSYRNVQLKCQYYYKIVEKFEQEGEDAFVKEQLKWLGKTEKEADELIMELHLDKVEKCYRRISEKFEELFNGEEEMDENGNVIKSTSDAAQWKHEMQKDFLVVVENAMYNGNDKKEEKKFNEDKISTNGTITRSTSHITGPNMEFLRTYCNLPYKVKVSKGKWIISKFKEIDS